MKYFVFVSVLGVALLLTTDISSSKNAAMNQAAAFNGVSALLQNSEAGSIETFNEGSWSKFDRAFDLSEGKSVQFEGLSVSFLGLTEEKDCEETACRTASVELSLAGLTEKVALSLNEFVDWEGYRIKISQIAPLQNPNNVPYRAVLLVRKDN